MMFGLGLLILFITVYLLVKQYETRMVLFAAGLVMTIIAGNPLAAFNAFSAAMKNANLIEPIVSAMGFAMVLQVTKCDQHLIHFLANLLKKAGMFLIPGAVLATAVVNTSITSAAGCSAAVGAILIPVLIGAGVRPEIAGASVFAGTYGSPMLNPGFGQISIVAGAAKTTNIAVVFNHASVVVVLALVAAISLTIVAYLRKEHTGYVQENFKEVESIKINYVKVIVPMIPLALLLMGSTGMIPLFKKLAISHAMIIGSIVALAVTRVSPDEVSKAFFKGFGDGFAQVFGIIAMALVFVAGLNSLGIIKAMIDVMLKNPAIAKVSATFGPFLLAVICGSGEAASIAFNQTVTVNAGSLGLNALDLGSLAAISGALGRTMSPIAGAAIICAGFAKVSPMELAKRNSFGMFIAAVLAMTLLMYVR